MFFLDKSKKKKETKVKNDTTNGDNHHK